MISYAMSTRTARTSSGGCGCRPRVSRYDPSTDAILGSTTRVRDDIGSFATKGWALHVASKLQDATSDPELSFAVVDEAGKQVFVDVARYQAAADELVRSFENNDIWF